MTSIACKIKRFACKIGISQSICMQTVKLHANGDFDRFCLQMGHFRFCTRLRFWSKIGWNRFCNVKKPILLAHRFCWEVHTHTCNVMTVAPARMYIILEYRQQSVAIAARHMMSMQILEIALIDTYTMYTTGRTCTFALS